jgi:hypothetical protein
MPDPIDADAIAENAAGPQSASGDGEAVSQFSISDQIEADRYAKSECGKANGVFPIAYQKLQRPGTA